MGVLKKIKSKEKKNSEIEQLQVEINIRNLVFAKLLENNELSKERLVMLINEVTEEIKGVST